MSDNSTRELISIYKYPWTHIITGIFIAFICTVGAVAIGSVYIPVTSVITIIFSKLDVFQQQEQSTITRSQQASEMLENYEVAHFRLMSDANFLPYGKSQIEGARKIFKQLTLMEDAMLIHRIMRAPEKRVFKLDI